MLNIYVDGSCRGNPGQGQYRGVIQDGDKFKDLFLTPVYPMTTNNIMEYLALCKAIMISKHYNQPVTIWSDSITAISWVKKKRLKSSIERSSETETMWYEIDTFNEYIKNVDMDNITIMKWDTKSLGEIPADFGRK